MVLVRMQCGKMPETTPESKLSFAWLRAHFIVLGIPYCSIVPVI